MYIQALEQPPLALHIHEFQISNYKQPDWK